MGKVVKIRFHGFSTELLDALAEEITGSILRDENDKEIGHISEADADYGSSTIQMIFKEVN